MMIYLLRHGEIIDASQKKYIGQSDVPLSRTGIKQAMYWREALVDVEFEAVFSSPLTRALETATLVSGLPLEGIIRIKQFQEINLGEWDGKPIAEVKRKFPDSWVKRGEDLAHYRPLGGESFSDLSQRVLEGFSHIIRSYSGNLLIVAHAGVNRVILCNLLDKKLEDLFQLPQDYAGMTLIRKVNKKLTVQGINRVPEYKSIQISDGDTFFTEPVLDKQ